jgi:hypothetical protein
MDKPGRPNSIHNYMIPLYLNTSFNSSNNPMHPPTMPPKDSKEEKKEKAREVVDILEEISFLLVSSSMSFI